MATARRFGKDATYAEPAGSGHIMTAGRFMPQTLAAFDRWAGLHGLLADAAAVRRAPGS
ncbi:hypothetical protein [Zavarzinia sp.]|uniref:hypothetical protein n=1 Tax=Zavarzinia sp. TaxID=2027920 RepID=UPI0035693F14